MLPFLPLLSQSSFLVTCNSQIGQIKYFEWKCAHVCGFIGKKMQQFRSVFIYEPEQGEVETLVWMEKDKIRSAGQASGVRLQGRSCLKGEAPLLWLRSSLSFQVKSSGLNCQIYTFLTYSMDEIDIVNFSFFIFDYHSIMNFNNTHFVLCCTPL